MRYNIARSWSARLVALICAISFIGVGCRGAARHGWDTSQLDMAANAEFILMSHEAEEDSELFALAGIGAEPVQRAGGHQLPERVLRLALHPGAPDPRLGDGDFLDSSMRGGVALRLN